jgi:hypothetical protein
VSNQTHMYSNSIHVHADDESCAIDRLDSPDPDVHILIYSKDGRDHLYVNLDEKLRLRLLYTLLTQEEKEAVLRMTESK